MSAVAAVFVVAKGRRRSESCPLVPQEYSGDAADLYLDMRETQIQQAAKDKRKQQLAVPGIINPHDRPDEMQE